MNGKPKFRQLNIPSVLLMSAMIIFVDTCYIISTVTAAYLLCETCIGGGLFPRLVFPELRRSSAGARVAVTVPLRHL